MRDEFFVCVDVRVEGYSCKVHAISITANRRAHKVRTKRGDIQRRVQDVEK